MTIGRVAASMPRPASSTTAPLTSAERATWPFLRASSRFLGVAFSVFSPPPRMPSSPPASRARRDGGLELVADAAGDERQRGARRRAKPTRILAGRPTEKTLSCGTTRETRPNAASVSTSASSTGAAIWSAPAKIAGERRRSRRRAARRARASRAAATSAYVSASPWMTSWSPLIAMKTMTPMRP